jgi:hypothetical protein
MAHVSMIAYLGDSESHTGGSRSTGQLKQDNESTTARDPGCHTQAGLGAGMSSTPMAE